MDIQILSEIYCALLYWYFILRFNHCVGHKLQIPDSTQSRDHEEDHIKFQQNYLDELYSIPTYIADTIYAAQNFQNLSVTVSALQFMTPQFYSETNNCKNFWTEKSVVAMSLIRI